MFAKKEPDPSHTKSKVDWPPRYEKYTPTRIPPYQILARIDGTLDDSLVQWPNESRMTPPRGTITNTVTSTETMDTIPPTVMTSKIRSSLWSKDGT